ncbi:MULTISPECIES: pyridoxamine 5'-phosphate oxidase family protein [Bifidobacterium]|nr:MULTISPECIES: pyridoxamine 5'-phosphate oxidase family protein [Bifidobacterium]
MNTLNDAIEALRGAGVFYLSTVDGDSPRTRPQGFVMDYDGRPAFTTHHSKPTYAQLQANPHVEVCAMNGRFGWIRLHGTARFITSDESRARCAADNPMLLRTFAPLGGDFEVFVLDDAEADVYSFGPDGNILKRTIRQTA